jgi:hypothetical protein
MQRKKKKKPLPPRRKRMKRAARLQAARHWIASFTGKHIIKAYARWFGVDLGCALKELQLLGIPLDPVCVSALNRTLLLRSQRVRPKPEPTGAEICDFSDDHFAYVAGYTAGGAPYGITWEEAVAIEAAEGGGLTESRDATSHD